MSQDTANIYPALYYADAPAALDWLARAFGFEQRLAVPGPDGTIRHAEMTLGPGVIMLGTADPARGMLSPRDLPGTHQSLCVYVDDPDAHYARAKAAGAEIVAELTDKDYGSRDYCARDPEGHHWTFGSYRPGAHWQSA